MGFFEKIKKGLKKGVGWEPWPVSREYFFVLLKGVYEKFMEISMREYPKEVVFYIIAQVKKTKKHGTFLLSDKVVEVKEKETGGWVADSDKSTGFPSHADIQRVVSGLADDEVLVLCHTHSDPEGKMNMVARSKSRLGARALGLEINNMVDFIRGAKVPPEKVFFAYFLRPDKEIDSAYMLYHSYCLLSVLMVQALDNNQVSRILVGKNSDSLLGQIDDLKRNGVA